MEQFDTDHYEIFQVYVPMLSFLFYYTLMETRKTDTHKKKIHSNEK